MAKRDSQDLNKVVKMILHMVEKDRTSTLAQILINLQAEYIEVCTLATDGEFDPDSWSHKHVLDFLTKGH